VPATFSRNRSERARADIPFAILAAKKVSKTNIQSKSQVLAVATLRLLCDPVEGAGAAFTPAIRNFGSAAGGQI
jgi:hypothetical protein